MALKKGADKEVFFEPLTVIKKRLKGASHNSFSNFLLRAEVIALLLF
jgi:hypothetical protein